MRLGYAAGPGRPYTKPCGAGVGAGSHLRFFQGCAWGGVTPSFLPVKLGHSFNLHERSVPAECFIAHSSLPIAIAPEMDMPDSVADGYAEE